ncbi:hypothetical protein M758_5G010400 [Ceratodon purpureus]|nr:hypothetical protein M758_5G010400 [Ceratodon purpureus]
MKSSNPTSELMKWASFSRLSRIRVSGFDVLARGFQIRIRGQDFVRDAKEARRGCWRRIFEGLRGGFAFREVGFRGEWGLSDRLVGWLVAMAGGMDLHKNVHIENWGAARENLEKTFRFTRRNITLALIFGIAVPFVTYQGVTGEFHKQDAQAGHPPRKFLGTQ